MKRFLAILLGLIMIISLTACGSKGGNNSPSSSVTPPEESEVNIDDTFTRTSKTLVVYFSKTNTTESVAKLIQSETGADIFEIERKEPYPDAYTPTTEVAKDEKDANARPELKTYLSKDVIAGYDTIFVGFPIWWGTAPMPVLSFLNFYDLSGKTIYTFCTAASSSISGSTADIRSNASGANVVEGKRFSKSDESGVKSWIASLNLSSNQPDTPAPSPVPSESNVLVVYFSASGNTERVAEYIAEATDGKCAAYAAAYLLRYFGEEADGEKLFPELKRPFGFVSAKSITDVFELHGYRAKAFHGNIETLKRQLTNGNPIIVFISIPGDTHYAVVVGYDEQFIYMADSLAENANVSDARYNRILTTKDFETVWKNGTLLPDNIYIVIEMS